MKLRIAKTVLALAVAAIGLSGHQERRLHAQGADDLVMVVNKGNTAAAGMTLAQARKLLLGETTTWRNGAKVVIVLGPAGSNDRNAVLKKVCGMTESAYTRNQMQASFTGGTAATLQVVAADAAVKGAVRANPGGVGFLHKGQVDATVTAVLDLP